MNLLTRFTLPIIPQPKNTHLYLTSRISLSNLTANVPQAQVLSPSPKSIQNGEVHFWTQAPWANTHLSKIKSKRVSECARKIIDGHREERHKTARILEGHLEEFER